MANKQKSEIGRRSFMLAAGSLAAAPLMGHAGVNLPMLLRALTYRDKDMETLVARATTGGRDGIVNMQRH